MGNPEQCDKYSQKLIKTFEFRVKPSEELDSKHKASEIYSKNIQDSIDHYETEMSKLLVNSLFLKDKNFEKKHLKNRNNAWELLKTHSVCDGDKFDFNKGITSCYLRFSQMNKDNRESSENASTNENKTKSVKKGDDTVNLTLALAQAQKSYIKRMKKILKDQKVLSKSFFKAKDEEIRKDCLELVSLIKKYFENYCLKSCFFQFNSKIKKTSCSEVTNKLLKQLRKKLVEGFDDLVKPFKNQINFKTIQDNHGPGKEKNPRNVVGASTSAHIDKKGVSKTLSKAKRKKAKVEKKGLESVS